jgi:hypothetical protein
MFRQAASDSDIRVHHVVAGARHSDRINAGRYRDQHAVSKGHADLFREEPAPIPPPGRKSVNALRRHR